MDAWNDERKLTDLDIDVPAWIDQDITPYTLAAIDQGGCSSGAYMPAVTYCAARETMHEHGDEVLDYLDAHEMRPEIDANDSWDWIACKYLSWAVEIWAAAALAEYEDLDEDEDAA